MQNYRMLLSFNNMLFSFLIPCPLPWLQHSASVSSGFSLFWIHRLMALSYPITLIISGISNFTLHCIVSEKSCLNSYFIQPVLNIPVSLTLYDDLIYLQSHSLAKNNSWKSTVSSNLYFMFSLLHRFKWLSEQQDTTVHIITADFLGFSVCSLVYWSNDDQLSKEYIGK